MDAWDGTIDNMQCFGCFDFDFYEHAEDAVSRRLLGIGLPICLILILGGTQLRRVPLYSQALMFSLPPLVLVLSICAMNAAYKDVKQLLILSLQLLTFTYLFMLSIFALIIWVVAPLMSAYVRKQRRAREVSRVWIVLMLIALAYWVLGYLRVYNAQRTLYTLIETHHGLEGVAAAVTYLTSSMLDLDVFFATLLPMALGIINSNIARSGGR